MQDFSMRRSSALALAGALLLAGCESASYYAQVVGGHLELMRRARPVDALLADGQTPQALREQLALAQRLRDFASRELGLPDNGSYRRFADLSRSYAVWNVFAAEEFSVDAVLSCFPVAGCVAYRGFFDRADAERHAARLRARQLDVAVLGVPAYSTLGAFDDPLLSTFIAWPEAELARLLFHELAHQVVYVKDDSTFNESFAVVVEREGVRRWFSANGREADLDRYRTARQTERQLAQTIEAARTRLRAIYAGGETPQTKRMRKRAVFEELAADPVFKRYAERTGAAANNALLVSYATYSQRVRAFERMLELRAGDLRGFYDDVRALAALDGPARQRRLDAYESAMSTTLR